MNRVHDDGTCAKCIKCPSLQINIIRYTHMYFKIISCIVVILKIFNHYTAFNNKCLKNILWFIKCLLFFVFLYIYPYKYYI